MKNVIGRKTIFILFSSPFMQISLIHTGIIENLLDKYNLVIITLANSHSVYDWLDANLKRKDYILEKIDLKNLKPNFAENQIYGFLRIKNRRNLSSYKLKKLSGLYQENTRFRTKWLRMVIEKILVLIPERFLTWFLNSLFSKPQCDRLISRYKPDLLITSTPGGILLEEVLIRSAKKFGVPVVSVDTAWSYLEKISWLPKVSRLLVHNEFMKNQAIRYHRYQEQNISIVGPLKYDVHRRTESISNRDRYFKKHKLDPSRKLATLAITPIGDLRLDQAKD